MKLLSTAVLLWIASGRSRSVALTINATDQMASNSRMLKVKASAAEVEVTLRNTPGKLPGKHHGA